MPDNVRPAVLKVAYQNSWWFVDYVEREKEDDGRADEKEEEHHADCGVLIPVVAASAGSKEWEVEAGH